MGGLPGVRRLDHVGVSVADLGEAVRFFVEVLGFAVLYGHAPPPPPGTGAHQLDRHPDTTIAGIAMLRLGDQQVELLAFAAPDQVRRPPRTSDVGGSHLALYVDDLDAAVAHLAAHDVPVLGEPMPLPGPEAGLGNRFAFARGPGGVILELISYPDGRARERRRSG